eukprot:jgi/Tetstr1/462895/TSEL_007844.t1
MTAALLEAAEPSGALLELAIREAACWLRGAAAKENTDRALGPLLAGVLVECVSARGNLCVKTDGAAPSTSGGGELSACVTVFGDELEWEADISVVEGQPTGLLQLDPFVSGYLGRMSGWQLSILTADSDWDDSGTSLRDIADRWRQKAGVGRELIGWLDVHRAVAACIGTFISMSAGNQCDWLVAAIMEVVEARMQRPTEHPLAIKPPHSAAAEPSTLSQRRERWALRRLYNPTRSHDTAPPVAA